MACSPKSLSGYEVWRMIDWKFILKNRVIHRREWRRIHEDDVKDSLKKIRGDLFIDIGSNKGIYANLLKDNFDQIITIDPNPKWKADKQIALSWYRGKARFFIGDGEGSADSLLHNPHVQGKDWMNTDSLEVEVMRFDDLALDADLVKIDVEGSEFGVLEGMGNYLPRWVMVELHDERREKELLKMMKEKGYISRKTDRSHWLFKR
jgi:FkbM family methyltransferase